MLTLQKKQQIADSLVKEIRSLHRPGERLRFMEVCGTHTVSIFREGIRQLLPEGIELVSGPGCPVCVTDQTYIDKALAYGAQDDIILATFGDMLKVPGSASSLGESKERGMNIEVVYSPMDALQLAKKNPNKLVVFLGIGFETTIAAIAGTIEIAAREGYENLAFLISHKLVPPALVALLQNPKATIDGFLLPGHVSVIIGEAPYAFLAKDYHMPCCIAGFDGLEILQAVASLMRQHRSGESMIDNAYRSVVAKKGNPTALALFDRLYEVCDEPWRGLGVVPQSGLRLRAAYGKFDIEQRRPLGNLKVEAKPTACRCGDVLQGLIQPSDCPLFGKACTPDHAVGACMVSVEGSCSAWYKYGRASGGLTWEE